MRIAHFSAGASSACAAIIGRADKLVYAETGAEHDDNERFISDIEAYLKMSVVRVKSKKFRDTWDVWEKEKYLANRYGAPCTRELKRIPLAPIEQLVGAVHIFGYAAEERARFKKLKRFKPDLVIECPLIDKGITSAGAKAWLLRNGIRPPLTYELGMPHANCIPCPKATSPGYWAMIRKHFPKQFERMVALEQKLANKETGKVAGLVRIKGQRQPLTELPDDTIPNAAEAPNCDLLCEATLKDGST